MRKKLLLLMIVLSVFFTTQPNVYESTLSKVVTRIYNLGGHIRQSDIENSPYASEGIGYKINTPGRYYLDTDLEATSSTTVAVIQINCNNVILEMEEKQISADSTTITTDGLALIQVTTAAENDIVIRNGTFNGGDVAWKGIEFELKAGSDRYTSVLLERLVINNCLQRGLELKTLESSFIMDCTVIKVLGGPPESCGFWFENCQNLNIIKCMATYAAYAGFYGSSASNRNFVFKECKSANQTEGYKVPGDDFYYLNCVALDIGGQGFNVGDGCAFLNCVAIGSVNNHNITSVQCGFLSSNQGSTFDHCFAMNFANGFILYDSGVTYANCIYTDCVAMRNDCGFHLWNSWAQSNSLVRCVSANNLQYGFYNPYTIQWNVYDCVAYNNTTADFHNVDNDYSQLTTTYYQGVNTSCINAAS